MKRIFNKFEDAMAAAAFAEAGEFQTAREMQKEKRRVLLALTGEKSDADAFTYALNICKRVGADLEILHVTDVNDDLIKTFQSQLRREGIGYHLTLERGCIKEQIIRHTNRKRDILFVVIRSSEKLNTNCKKPEKALDGFWAKLNCPLVVVSDASTA